MPNSISLAQNFLPLLDEVYKYASKTSLLDATQVEFVNANTVKVFKTSMDGMGNYGRNSGFVDGSVVGAWETMELTKDRGRSFMIDAMDDEETIGISPNANIQPRFRSHIDIPIYTENVHPVLSVERTRHVSESIGRRATADAICVLNADGALVWRKYCFGNDI